MPRGARRLRVPHRPARRARTALCALLVGSSGWLGCGGTSSSTEHVTTTPVPVVTPMTPEPPPTLDMPRPPLTVEAPADVTAPPAYAERTPSGLWSRLLYPGTGAHPRAQDVVVVRYTGWTTDGNTFDTTLEADVARAFPLRAMIPGWAEGLMLMREGEQRRMWIPEVLAYDGSSNGPAGMLVYDIELLGVEASPPDVPEDVASPPSHAEVTASGLASEVVWAGSGSAHPSRDSRVTVHYSGWTTDGAMFDSSITRGRPATFPLSAVILGWTEGVQLMVVGEKRRFWIPAQLAYGNAPGRPQGMLVFDVTLLSYE